jgi:hypothetical protein
MPAFIFAKQHRLFVIPVLSPFSISSSMAVLAQAFYDAPETGNKMADSRKAEYSFSQTVSKVVKSLPKNCTSVNDIHEVKRSWIGHEAKSPHLSR